MALSVKGNTLISRLKTLLTLQRFNHSLAENGLQAKYTADMGSNSLFEKDYIDVSKWRKVDSRKLGITREMISSPSWIVLKVLQNQGFEAYLVGGCVRDLLLHKTPKDFDVITTAKLKQIRKKFHRAEIVGRRFPICMVHLKGSVVEVSSFETVPKSSTEKENFLLSSMPHGCDKKDVVRWRNCMHRDFTVNSLFFDPFANKIYDYTNGMMDLRFLKLQTLIPAQLSFKEDCARILRGLRIAARLGLSFSKETEMAIRKLSSSISSLNKSRVMMEVNYMLSYGAAKPSLCLLRRFNLLEILLPFHAAYLAQQATKRSSEDSMFMKLFFNLDKLVTCDRPSYCNLWVGLLAFHMALVNKPQDALVVWTFASILYHGEWKQGVTFAREHAQAPSSFVPEISEPCDVISDDELAGRVSQLACLVQDSVDALTKTDNLLATMAIFPDSQCSGLVFVSNKMGKHVAQLFDELVHDVESFKRGRKTFEIDYTLLGKGNLTETSFVLGKVIMDTMNIEVGQLGEVVKEKDHLKCNPEHTKTENKKHSRVPSIAEQQERAKKQKMTGKECNLSEQGVAKKQQASVNKKSQEMAGKKREIIENKQFQEVAKKHLGVIMSSSGFISCEVTKEEQETEAHKSQLEEIIMMRENAFDGMESQVLSQEMMENKQKVVENEKCWDKVGKHLEMVGEEACHTSLEETHEKWHEALQKCDFPQEKVELREGALENKKRHSHQRKMVAEKIEKHKTEIAKEQCSRPRLSSLFK